MGKLFLNNRFILILILINAVGIFIAGFELPPKFTYTLNIIDNTITILFIIEIIVKLKEFGLKYFKDGWNIFDFVLVVVSLPALFMFLFKGNPGTLSFILAFRVFRVFKSFRFLKFIPGIDNLIDSIQRALKASVFVIIGFFIYLFITSILSFHLFHGNSTYFVDPMYSLYSIFMVFTVEGWYEIPKSIIAGGSNLPVFFIRGYFMFILLTGGIFGLSLVNSIFVDAMVSDNNDSLEEKVDYLTKLVEKLKNNQENLEM